MLVGWFCPLSCFTPQEKAALTAESKKTPGACVTDFTTCQRFPTYMAFRHSALVQRSPMLYAGVTAATSSAALSLTTDDSISRNHRTP